MRRFSVILLAGLLSLLGTSEMLRAQVIEGRITNAATGKPLVGVNVFLSHTKIGTATNLNGQYRLEGIPTGGHRLVISIIGYKREILEIIVGPHKSRTMDFELVPVIYEMPQIYVGNLDKKWEKRLERFTDLFIGKTVWSDSVIILNPEVLRFETRWWGRLSAEALAPLKIENRALGYHITYFLEEFDHTGTRTRWDGEPLFTEMQPADSAQAAYWQKNRREAFYGSLRHFLLALLNDRIREEGFVLHNLREGVYGYSPDKRYRTTRGRLIRDGVDEFLYDLNFFGRLEIVYTRDAENWHYVRWRRDYQDGPNGVQTSFLELNERPVTVDKDGEILQPYGATQFGYFAFQRLAEETPREYRPDESGVNYTETATN